MGSTSSCPMVAPKPVAPLGSSSSSSNREKRPSDREDQWPAAHPPPERDEAQRRCPNNGERRQDARTDDGTRLKQGTDQTKLQTMKPWRKAALRRQKRNHSTTAKEQYASHLHLSFVSVILPCSPSPWLFLAPFRVVTARAKLPPFKVQGASATPRRASPPSDQECASDWYVRRRAMGRPGGGSACTGVHSLPVRRSTRGASRCHPQQQPLGSCQASMDGVGVDWSLVARARCRRERSFVVLLRWVPR